MQIIVITLPQFITDEGMFINALFEAGVDRVHIRKPGASVEEHRKLIEEIDRQWHGRLSIHDCHCLALEYGCGVHLNGRNPNVPRNKVSKLSASCHSIEEVMARKEKCDYVFLSPIFDSISKQGYQSAFSQADIENAAKSGVVDDSVIALGGISLERTPLVEAMGFGGAALLGDVWKDVTLFCRNLRQTHLGRTTARP